MRKYLSAETISVAQYVLPRGALRQARKARRPRSRGTDRRGQIPNMTPMAEHERLAERLTIRVFFADSYSPWQRGINEHTNGLRRQYLPKGTDLLGYTQRELNAIAHRLNTRPRKCLLWATPLEVFTQLRHHSPVALGT